MTPTAIGIVLAFAVLLDISGAPVLAALDDRIARRTEPADPQPPRLRLAVESGATDPADPAWKELEAEQERRRRAREQADTAPRRVKTRALPEKAKRAVPPKPKLERPVAVRRSPPERVRAAAPRDPAPRRAASAPADPYGNAAACYRQVGIQVDAAGRPIRGAAAGADERSQAAFLSCIDGR